MVKKTVAGIRVPSYANNAALTDFVLRVYAAVGCNYSSAGDTLGVNAATIWKMANCEQRDSPILREKWDIKYNKPRPRVSVPTNNINSALEIISRHYPEYEIKAIKIAEES